jgi:DNA-binding transcriptional ArsR family regulator
MADIFQVISDSTRRDLLSALLEAHKSQEELSVTDLVTQLGVNQPAVSKHLKILREAELVHVREDGQHRYYSLNAEPLTMVEDFLLPFLTSDIESEVTVEYVSADGEVLDPEGELVPGSALAMAESVGRAAATARHQVKELVARFHLRP